MKFHKHKHIFVILCSAGLIALALSILGPFTSTFTWMEGNLTLTPQEKSQLTALNEEFDVTTLKSVSDNAVLGVARRNSLTASVLLSNMYPHEVQKPDEVLLETTHGDILLAESAQSGRAAEMIDAYKKLPFIAAAEENQEGVIFADLPTTTSGTPGSKILEELGISGKKSVVKVHVAILDSGLDFNHPAFSAANLWENSAEKNGVSGKDDDRDGLVDDIYGWNFAQNKASLTDDNGHGTHIAGIIAAQKTDLAEMQGINPDGAELMILKVAGSDGTLKLSSVLSALDYVKKHPVDVVNMSFGFDKGSDIFSKKVQELKENGIFLVAAAGNNNDDAPRYPAAYSDVLAVGALDSDGSKWTTSNFGNWVDIGAPAKLLSTLPDRNYGTKSGTSQAAAIITGAYSYYKSQFPEKTSAEITESLENYAGQFDRNAVKHVSENDFSRPLWVSAMADIMASGRQPNLLEDYEYALSRRVSYAEVGGFLLEYLGSKPAVLEALAENKAIGEELKTEPLPVVVSPDLLMTPQFKAALFSEETVKPLAILPLSRRLVKEREVAVLLQKIRIKLHPDVKIGAIPPTDFAAKSLFLTRRDFLELVREVLAPES